MKFKDIFPYSFKSLRKEFNIPAEETVMAVIALGYRAGEPKQPGHRPFDEVVKFF